MGLTLDWLKEDQRKFLIRREGYLKKGITPEKRYQKIADTIQEICNKNTSSNEDLLSWYQLEHPNDNYTTEEIGKRFEKYISKGWASFASPVLANFGEEENLPISCNHGKIADTLDSILGGLYEMGMLAKYGAGTAKNFSNIRAIGEPISTGGKSEGIIPWIELYADAISKVTQGSVRRGFFTAYLSVAHKQILDFLKIGGKSSDIQNITTAVTIPKGWMDSLEKGEGNTRKVWSEILKSRAEKGFPYILFEENCNKNSPQVYIDKDMWIDNANICIEAIEYCDQEKEFACCLSSVNAYYFDEWKDDPYFLRDMYVMLDCVITEYIEKGKNLPGMQKAIKFAEEHRAIGLGVLGFHTYLQKNMISFGSIRSYGINNEMFSLLRKEGEKATKWMAEVWGEPEILKGYKRRNTSLMAQAPTKSTSFIMGGTHLSLSEGIEVRKSNYNEKSLAKIQVENKNRELEKLLEEKGQNTRKVWNSILKNNGSVQHLEFLSEDEKEVFKTFSEVSQLDIIKLAAQRQKYIDMGQSINLMIHPKTPAKDVHSLVMEAYKSGVKSLYYHYSINAAQEFNKSLLECSACEA